MHMSNALLSPAVAGVMSAASGVAIATSVMKLRRSTKPVKVAEAGVMGAFVFAAQMINFAIPCTGSSGHLCGGMLLAAKGNAKANQRVSFRTSKGIRNGLAGIFLRLGLR